MKEDIENTIKLLIEAKEKLITAINKYKWQNNVRYDMETELYRIEKSISELGMVIKIL